MHVLRTHTFVVNTGELKELVLPQYSEKGSNKRPREEQSWIFFGDFLDECEGKS